MWWQVAQVAGPAVLSPPPSIAAAPHPCHLPPCGVNTHPRSGAHASCGVRRAGMAMACHHEQAHSSAARHLHPDDVGVTHRAQDGRLLEQLRHVVLWWCCGVVVLWCCGVVVLWCCGVVFADYRRSMGWLCLQPVCKRHTNARSCKCMLAGHACTHMYTSVALHTCRRARRASRSTARALQGQRNATRAAVTHPAEAAHGAVGHQQVGVQALDLLVGAACGRSWPAVITMMHSRARHTRACC
jgi:hypothetical protein